MDIVVSFIGLLLLLPIFLIIGILIKRDSPGPVFYRGKRAGKGGGTFGILKFRTMYERPASYEGSKVTAVNDNRITPLGRWLRDTKVNELPQLWNVLKGEMSLVGPRPEDPDIAATWDNEVRDEILSVRSGITSPASVIYRHEEKLLNTKDVMTTYIKSILPSKMRLDQLYIRNRSFWLDLDVIFWTLLVLWPGLGEYQPPENDLFWGPVYRLFSRYIKWFMVDALIAVFAFEMVAFVWESQERFLPTQGGEIAVTLGFVVLFNLIGAFTGLNRIAWSKAVFNDVFDMVPALLIATFVALLMDDLLDYMPTGLILLSSALASAGFIAARYRNHLASVFISKALHFRAGGLSSREKVLIIGSGQAGQFAAKMLSFKEGTGAYHLIGFIDDDYHKTGERIQGTRVVGGREDIPNLVKQYDVGVIIFAIHNIDSKDREEILDICNKTQASVFMLPDFLGALHNFTSAANRQAGKKITYPIDLSERDKSPFSSETVYDRVSFLKSAELFFHISKETSSHLAAIAAEVHPLDLLSDKPDSELAEALCMQVAVHCREVLRNIDIIGLYESGKIMILISDQKGIPVKIITDRLIRHIEESGFEVGEHRIRVKLNIGIANRSERTSTLISLFKCAVTDLMITRQANEPLAIDQTDSAYQQTVCVEIS